MTSLYPKQSEELIRCLCVKLLRSNSFKADHNTGFVITFIWSKEQMEKRFNPKPWAAGRSSPSSVEFKIEDKSSKFLDYWQLTSAMQEWICLLAPPPNREKDGSGKVTLEFRARDASNN